MGSGDEWSGEIGQNGLLWQWAVANRVEVLDSGFGAGPDVELFVDVFEVAADGFDADVEAVGNFLVGEAFGDEFNDFGFAVRKFDDLILLVRGRLVEGFDNAAGDFGAHRSTTSTDIGDRLAHFRGARALEEVSAGTGF